MLCMVKRIMREPAAGMFSSTGSGSVAWPGSSCWVVLPLLFLSPVLLLD